ncbi:MAG: MFS transporter [Thermoplasmata archaeon]|nr:MFS transporter [Thermoplasmata archaeon]
MFKEASSFRVIMDRRAFAGLMIIEMMLAFGNTFAGSFNLIFVYKELEMPIWSGPLYLCIGFFIAALVGLWMSWRPHLDPRNAMLTSLVCLIGEYAIFLTVRDGWILLITVGVAFGLFYPLFWTPFNVVMAQMTKKTNRGVTYGAFFFVWPLATFFAPFLGGLVIGYFDYQVLFALGIVIIVTTAAMVIAYRNYMPRDQVMRIRVDALGRRNAIALLGEGGFEGVFWVDVTLVAYVFTADEVELGVMFSLFGLSAGIMAVILGKVSDKIQNRRFFAAASAVASIPCVLLISLSETSGQYLAANGMLEFASFMFPVFLFAILTDRLEETKNDSVLGREFLLDVGRTCTIATLMLLLYLGVSPQHCFLLAVPFLAMVALAHESKKDASSADGAQR